MHNIQIQLKIEVSSYKDVAWFKILNIRVNFMSFLKLVSIALQFIEVITSLVIFQKLNINTSCSMQVLTRS